MNGVCIVIAFICLEKMMVPYNRLHYFKLGLVVAPHDF